MKAWIAIEFRDVCVQMPHSDSGYSPFDLVYGFRVRTLLDAQYHGLYEVESEKLNVYEWVTRMAERLECVRDSAALRVAKSKGESYAVCELWDKV